MSETHDSDATIPSWRRTIVYHAAREALSPMTDVILRRLGYQILLPGTLAGYQKRDPSIRAELRLVDERRFEEVPSRGDGDVDAELPIILLTGKEGSTGEDPRVVGAVKRPAGLHDLYRLMQQVFEDYPRSCPRVATEIPAHCEYRGVAWEGRVISLSENGCLIRSPEAILLGQKLKLELALPHADPLELEGEATYQLLPDTGLVFNALHPSQREVLERFVTATILA